MAEEPEEKVTRHYIKYVFLDVVRFSERSAEAQSAIVRILNRIVLDVLKDHQLKTDDRILIPTGDGMCIAFISAELPYDIHIRIALGIVSRVHNYNDTVKTTSRQFHVRVGINQNTDIIVTDVNENTNVAGAGVNLASRIMDKADGNQVLVSQTVYDELQPSEKYMDKFRSFDAKSKHGLAFRVFQYCGTNHPGLNRDLPSEFAPKKISEPQLSKEVGYYFAHAIKNRPFIIAKQGSGQNNYNLTVILWFLAEDSVGESEATEIQPYERDIYGKGGATLEQIYDYYNKQDFDLVCAFAQSIADKLEPYSEFWEGGTGFVPLFITPAGIEKLKKDCPEIWKEFDLDSTQGQPVSLQVTRPPAA